MEDFRAALIKVYSKTNRFGELHGMELTKFEADGIEYRMKVKEEHLATPTTAHGGLVAAYMDGVLGVAALYNSSERGRLVATVEFKINFLAPVFKNDILIGRGEVVSAGQRIIVATGEIINEESGQQVAIATGTFNSYPYEKSGMSFEDVKGD